jgi:glycosyltransferase involved in cell wall biosynthesis
VNRVAVREEAQAVPRTRPVEVLMVVNERAPEGNMARRAGVFRQLLAPEFRVTVVAAPKRPSRAAICRADLVYVIDPGRIGFPAAVSGWASRRPVVVEMGDPQAALYRAQGRGAFSRVAGAAIDLLLARKATAIVVRGRGLADVLSLRVPWVEIPDGVDVERFVQGVDGELRQELGIPADALVAGLAGSLREGRRRGSIYGWDLVEALGLLRDWPVWALIVGSGTGYDALLRYAAELGVSDRLVMPGHVTHDQIPRYVAAMDVCLSRQTNDAVGWSRTTAKLPEYLACDRYVLATDVGGAAEVLPAEMLLPYHGSYDEHHAARLAARLAALAPRQAQLRRGAGTRKIALERYSYPALAKRLGAFLHEVTA